MAIAPTGVYDVPLERGAPRATIRRMADQQVPARPAHIERSAG